jgi:extracellular elastinolytic metalloproteinase
MNMGAFPPTSRHTALDSTVVFHEYTHGVTNRLVGGQRDEHALEQPQSRGMGEGWGDYIACTINKTDVVGAWLLNKEAGNRGFRYDDNFPDGFDKLGTGRYTEIHNIGEIWCATLMEMNRKIGDTLGLQLVVDALKLSPANPSFLDMRDSIIAALRNRLLAQQISQSAHDQALQGIWAAFARFGMGPAARCDGAELSGIVADFNVPAETGAMPPSPVTQTEPAPPPAVTGTATQPLSGADLHLEGKPNAAIPDGDPKGITDTITVTKPGAIAGVSVSFSVQHSYPADLQIVLTPPGGTNIVLYNRTWTEGGHLSRTMGSADLPALAALTGQNVGGAWALKVADVASGETGTFQSWSLDFKLKGG